MFGFLRSGSSSGARVERMAARDAIAKVATGEIVLVDVREGMELRASGRAQGAVHVPLAALRMKCDPSSPECLKEFKQGKPIGIYCASGARSSGAGQMLLQMGHTAVYNLGGFYEWQSAGGKVVR
jgi:rhodanese-related sulfurtransferase